jgi:antirestriction protein ArdC
MRRHQPTPEQKAQAAERRARFTELAKQIAALTDDERGALVARVGAIVTCEGRALSVHNSCLVLTQLPTASMVGGFRQWQAHGRSVRKGEHGLMIWVPTSRTTDAEPAAPAADAGETEGEGKRAGFVMGTVFDVTQTEPTAERERAEQPDAAAVGSR